MFFCHERVRVLPAHGPRSARSALMSSADVPRPGGLRGRMAGLGLALVALAACGGGTPPAARAPQGPPPALVQLSTLTPVPLEDASEYVATLQSMSTTSIQPEVAGQVTRILVRSGQRVRPGAPLFQIDPRFQRAVVSSQHANLAAQQATVAYAKQELERSRTLLAAGAISQQDFEQAQTTYETARAQLGALGANLHQSRVTLQYYQVLAPTDGIVGDIPVRVGMHVTTDTVLTTVNRNQDMEVYVQVPLDRIGDLRPGLAIELLGPTDAVLARTKIFFISPTVSADTQTVLVKGRLAGSSALRSAQYVRARIVWRTTTGLVVPVLSITRINGQPFVFVAEQQHGHLVARQQLVQLGGIVGNNQVVLGGLTAGQQIVVSGIQRLFDGASIRAA